MLTIVVPFYKNPQLADQMGASLKRLGPELRRIDADVVWINDSPDDIELHRRLTRWKSELSSDVAVSLVVNPENRGFVYSSNLGLARAKARGADALMLNSDVVLSSGALAEILRVSKQDEMIGFVSPRSNNATIASLPFAGRFESRTFEDAYHRFQLLASLLPEWHYVPTGIGFCLLIKHIVLQEFGILDPAYSLGYNEENDLIFRANRAGYRAVLANRAFAFHESSSSFEEEKRERLEAENRNILQARYPEYARSIEDYLESPLFQYERLIAVNLQTRRGDLRLALDFSHFRPEHTGTFEFGLALLSGLVSLQDPTLQIAVICDEASADFHAIERLFPTVQRVEVEDRETIFHVVLKPAQPFGYSEFEYVSRRGLYNFFFMLDTIALDCLYLRQPDTESLWRLVGETFDGVLFISDFSQEQYNLRFPRDASAPPMPQLACQLSVKERDYKDRFLELHRRPGSGMRVEQLDLPEDFVLLIGNHFHHKFIEPAAKFLVGQFPEHALVAVGPRNSSVPELKLFHSGSLSDAQVGTLFECARCMVFPSHYEGFGFPVVHALAAGKTVFARENSLNRQIGERWNGGGRLVLFRDLEDLGELLRAFFDSEPEFLRKAKKKIVQRQGTAEFGWQEMGECLVSFVRKTLAADPLARRPRSRLQKLIQTRRLLQVDLQEVRQKGMAARIQELEAAQEVIWAEQRRLQKTVQTLERQNSEKAQALEWFREKREELVVEVERTKCEQDILLHSPAFRIGKQITGIVKRIPGSKAVYGRIKS